MCGIFGGVGIREAAAVTGRALLDLEHRGQNSTGIVWRTRKGELEWLGDLGLASSVLARTDLSLINTASAIGHTRYATTGSPWDLANVGPQIVETRWGPMAVSHNGNLVNTTSLKRRQSERGVEHKTTTDTEVLIQEIALADAATLEEAIVYALRQVEGSYSLCILTPSQLIAARDPNGIRPLELGRIGNGYVVASETCVFTNLGATYIREVKPGELLIFDQLGCNSMHPFDFQEEHPCVFEEIYFRRPDSMHDGISMQTFRERLGRMLSLDAPPLHPDSIIVPVPRSGIPAAHGYAQASGRPIVEALVRRPGTHRTFIETGQINRSRLAQHKYAVIGDRVVGEHVVLVDDSLVRGTTTGWLVSALRAAGALSIDIRVASPRIEHPCLYGIDMPTREELIAASMTNQEIAQTVNADSVAFLALSSLERAVGGKGRCKACFTGDYPIRLPKSEGLITLTT